MKEWIFKDADNEKVFLRADEGCLRIVPKRWPEEEIVLPAAEIEKITYRLLSGSTQLLIYCGQKTILLTGSKAMEEGDVRGLLPGLNVCEEDGRLSAREWAMIALLAVLAVGLIAFVVFLSQRAVPWLLCVFPLFALMDASTNSRWPSWLKTALFGLYMQRLYYGFAVVSRAQVIMPALLITAVMLLLMFLVSRAKPKRAGRRLLALTLITALVYAPQAAVVLNAALPAKGCERFQVTVTESEPAFGRGWRVAVEEFDVPLSSLEIREAGEMIGCRRIAGGLGMEYIVIEEDLGRLNELGLAK